MSEQVNEQLLDFLAASPTCFHAVAEVRRQLLAAAYEELREGNRWQLQAGGKYFITRNGSSVIAFRLPEEKPSGFMIAASHSDSPAFKVKENAETVKENYTLLNVEKYGGMLCAPWFDRPLSVAGRIVTEADGRLTSRLVNVDRDLVMIPNLAIHMNRSANEGIAYNVQDDMEPVFAQQAEPGRFMQVIAESAGIRADEIIAHDLYLYARGRGTVWGADGEFFSAGHLDDLQCGFANLHGFLAAAPGRSVPVLAIFDNEEVGSLTKQGADSTFLEDTLRRIHSYYSTSEEDYHVMIAGSFMVSADNAHAVHPNYAGKADPTNRPALNKGIVIKYHGNQKYTSDAVSAAVFKTVCRKAGVPFQIFTNRSDMLSGSTLGNLSNAHVSLNSVDIGLPQWAMHSPYETAGTKDTEYLIQAMKVYFSLSLLETETGVWTLG